MLLLKSLHLLGVIAWLAGIFYLPRIFVHYAEGSRAGEDVRRLQIMAMRLYGFMTVMGILAMFFGLWLVLAYGFSGTWLKLKLILVGVLLIYHYLCRRYLLRINDGKPLPKPWQLRLFNETPLLIVVPIILLVVMKPY